MAEKILGTQVITQIGILVKDIEKTSKAYADFLGIDKPVTNLTGPFDQTQLNYKGEPSYARAKLATFHMGPLQLDLIEPDEHPSIWRETLENKGEGVLHIAFVVEGMTEKMKLMESNLMPMLQYAEFPGGRYAYFDTVKDLKLILEMMEFNH